METTTTQLTDTEIRRLQDATKYDPIYAYRMFLYKHKSSPEVMELIMKYLPVLEDEIKNRVSDAYKYILYEYKDIPEVMELIVKYMHAIDRHIEYSDKSGCLYLYRYKEVAGVEDIIAKHLPAFENYVKKKIAISYVVILSEYMDVPEVMDIAIKYAKNFKASKAISNKEDLVEIYRSVPEVYNAMKLTKVKVKSLT